MTEQANKYPFETTPTRKQLLDHFTGVITRYLVEKVKPPLEEAPYYDRIEAALRSIRNVAKDDDVVVGDRFVTRATAIKFLRGEIGLGEIKDLALTVVRPPKGNKKIFITSEGPKNRSDLNNYFTLRSILSVAGKVGVDGKIVTPLQEQEIPQRMFETHSLSPFLRDDSINIWPMREDENPQIGSLTKYGAVEISALYEIYIKDWLKSVKGRFQVQTIKANERFENATPKRKLGIYFDENGMIVPFQLQESLENDSNSSANILCRLDRETLNVIPGNISTISSDMEVIFVTKRDYEKLFNEREGLQPKFSSVLRLVLSEAVIRAWDNLRLGNY